MYAYFKKLDYFSTVYSPDANCGHARAFLKDLEAARPSAIIDIIHFSEAFEVKDEIRATQKAQQTCMRSGYMSSNDLCKACSLLEGLERGMSTAAITDKGRRKLEAQGPAPDNLRTILISTRQIVMIVQSNQELMIGVSYCTISYGCHLYI